MRVKKTILNSFIAITLITLFIIACQKSVTNQPASNASTQNISVYLADAPTVLNHVFIEIHDVKILVDTCKNDDGNGDDNGNDGEHHDGNDDDRDGNDNSCNQWQDLNVIPGIYDILAFRNGIDTLLANGNVHLGKLRGIEVTLGTHNAVVIDSTTIIPIILPDNDSTIRITLKGDEFEEFSPGRKRIWLDFDLSKSIIKINDSTFQFKPVIRLFNLLGTGEIEGKVSPRQANPQITVMSFFDTLHAIPNDDGEFKIRGVKPGVYTVFVAGSNGYNNAVINNVIVKPKEDTHLQSVTLHK